MFQDSSSEQGYKLNISVQDRVSLATSFNISNNIIKGLFILFPETMRSLVAVLPFFQCAGEQNLVQLKYVQIRNSRKELVESQRDADSGYTLA